MPDSALACRKCGAPGTRRSDGKIRCQPCVRAYRKAYLATAKGRAKRREQHQRYKRSPAGKAARKRRSLKQAADPQKRVRSRKTILRRYGMTPANYERMVAAQDGLCAICRERHDHLLHVDHDHQTGATRSLLCRRCNNGLGQFNDNICLMVAAIRYVLEHQAQASKSTLR